jgi:hypothetical protein
MVEYVKQSPYLWIITSLMVLLSLIADLLSIYIGVAWGKDGFIQKLNWSLYPFFFLMLAIIVHSIWSLYLSAWRSLPKNHVIYQKEERVTDDGFLDNFLSHIQNKRKYLVFLSIFLGLLLTAIDAGPLWFEYDIFSGNIKEVDEDFTIAYRLQSHFPPVTKYSNGLFNMFVYSLQGFLIAYGWLVLFQITLHGYLFWRFENSKYAKEKGIAIRLNYQDPIREFGLSEVNRAINSVYITIVIGMMIPIISATYQNTPAPDLGQILLQWLLPLVLLVPLLIPLADRYSRLKEVTDRVLKSSDTTASSHLKEQILWPFERTQIGYIGKAAAGIAAVEYTYVYGGNLVKIINAITKSILG